MDQAHQSNTTNDNTDSAEHVEVEPPLNSAGYSKLPHSTDENTDPVHESGNPENDMPDAEGNHFKQKIFALFGVLGRPFGYSAAAKNPSDANTPDEKKTDWQKKLFDVCDFLACPLVYFTVANANKKRWESLPEEKKVFIYKKGRMVFVRNLVHAAPFLAALTLVALNCNGYYLGAEMQGASGTTAEKMFALVLTAKLHELLMLVSLSTIITTHVRKELVFGRGLPFGAIFSPHRFQTPGFLFSRAFSGVCFRPWPRARDKWWFIILIVLCSTLSVLVGPASSLLARPRRGNWNGGGTSFWINATQEQLNPTVLNSSHIPSKCLSDPRDFSCPSGGWRTISDLFLSYWPQVVPMGSVPDQFQLTSRHSERTIRILTRQSSRDSRIIWGYDSTIASVPHAPVADAVSELGRLWSKAAAREKRSRLMYREDVLFSVYALQPMVVARCQHWDTNRKITFPIIGSAQIEDGDVVLEVLPLKELSLSILSFLMDIDTRKKPVSKPSVTWTDDPALMERLNASIASIVVVPTESSNDLFCCSSFAAWMVAPNNAKWSVRKIVDGWPANAQHANRLGAFNAAKDPLPGDKPIKIMGSWALNLFPFHPETNSSTFDAMMRSAGLWNTTTPTRSPYTRSIIETLLASSLVDGIARTSYTAQLRLDLLKSPANSSNLWGDGAWMRELLQSSRFVSGGTGNAAFTPPEDPENNAKFNFDAKVTGLAYTTDGLSVQAMIAALVVYMLVVVYHMVLSLLTELSSADWGSSPDVTVLAMTATRTAAFKNTGAGIDGLDAYGEKVRVKAVDGKLKMLIGDSHEDHDRAEAVRPNERYG